MKRKISIAGLEDLQYLFGHKKELGEYCSIATDVEEQERTIKACEFMGIPVPKRLTALHKDCLENPAHIRTGLGTSLPKFDMGWFMRWKASENLTDSEQAIIVENTDIEHVIKHATPSDCVRALRQPFELNEDQLFRLLRKTPHIKNETFSLHPRNTHCLTWKVLLQLTSRQFVDYLDKLICSPFCPTGTYPEAEVKGRLFQILLKDEKRKTQQKKYGNFLSILSSPLRFKWNRVLMKETGYYGSGRDHVSVDSVILFGLYAAGHQVPKEIIKALNDVSRSSRWTEFESNARVCEFLESHPPHPKTMELIETGELNVVGVPLSPVTQCAPLTTTPTVLCATGTV